MSDEPLGCLLRLLWIPYELWKAMSEQSRVGTSEMDREAGRFWKKFAIGGTVVVMMGFILWIWATSNKS